MSRDIIFYRYYGKKKMRLKCTNFSAAIILLKSFDPQSQFCPQPTPSHYLDLRNFDVRFQACDVPAKNENKFEEEV